jgi:hypothetical protein
MVGTLSRGGEERDAIGYRASLAHQCAQSTAYSALHPTTRAPPRCSVNRLQMDFVGDYCFGDAGLC